MERIRFFDGLSDLWDDICDIPRVAAYLRAGLSGMGIGPSERIVDVGCGTGTLLGCLLESLGPEGMVYAVDISPRMIEKARAKVDDPRVSFAVTSADRLGIPDASVDRIFCFSCWPHIDRPERVLTEFSRVLRPGGRLCIWHADGRETINGIHRNAGAAVASDTLGPGEELGSVLHDQGFDVHEVIDSPEEYRVSAVLRARREA